MTPKEPSENLELYIENKLPENIEWVEWKLSQLAMEQMKLEQKLKRLRRIEFAIKTQE